MHDQRDNAQPKPCVLIVSHDPGNRKMLVEILSLEGYPTEVAHNGEEGLEFIIQANDRGRNLIVLLHYDPHQDMHELLKIVHVTPHLHARHRIIAFEVEAYLRDVRSMGADDTLAMPYRIDDLLDVVERNAAALRRT